VAVNAQYNVAKPDSLPIKIAAHQRRKMFAAFLGAMRVSADDTVLDIGATSDQTYAHSNYFEALYPHKTRVTAVGIDDAAFIESLYPGVRFIRANGLDLPFKNGSFDYVHSSAVLEHVGQQRKQAQFLREIWRVARKGVFVTTPNRGFPVEFHTVLPLLHWLPMPLYRKALTAIGKEFFAAEENLNLLSRRSLAQVAQLAGLKSIRVSSVSLLGWPTNLLLISHKERPNFPSSKERHADSIAENNRA
jgi:ubiquinone/menaquinone biosynthesis C-methylase UbiE